jgi:hypothetical protein
MDRTETQVIVTPNAIRKDGDHVVTVSDGMFAGGLRLTFNGPMSKEMAAVSGGEGFAWFIDAETASRLVAAMQHHATAT